MKAKKGKCVDCPSGTPEKYLIAKRCEFHYKLHRNKVNAGKKHNVEKREYKKELNVYFANQILITPKRCEECGADLSYWKNSMPRAIIAHILPKSKFKSVATHPKNKMFFCPSPCHADFDNKGEDFAKTMKSLPLMRERFEEFKNLLTSQELARVPKYLKK